MGDLFDGFGTAILSGVGVFIAFLVGRYTVEEIRNIRLRRKLRKEGRIFVPTGLSAIVNQIAGRWF